MSPEKETFLARIMRGSRITVYEPVRENLGIEEGDLLRVTVHIERKSGELPTSHPSLPEAVVDTIRRLEEPIVTEVEPDEVVEDDVPVVDPEEPPVLDEPEDLKPQEPDEEEPIEEVMEPPSIEEVTTVTGADEEIVVFDEEPEEVVEYVVTEPIVPDYTEELEEEKESEQEYVEPCPSGLDFPLQDLEICRVWKCEHYKRKYGDKSEACNWPDWKKVGWEDELEEEPEEDLVEESETEEPAIEPEEAPEDAEEIEETEVAMLLCESGAHIAELTPHRKTDLGHGWAKYACMVCKKETTTVISRIEG